MKLAIVQLHPTDAKIIQDLANQIWPDTFATILSDEQINYMLNWMYDLDTLGNQMRNGHVFYGIKDDTTWLGFIGFSTILETNKLKIHKLYVLPNKQGKGIGLQLFKKAIVHARQENLSHIQLNVNRFNKALGFYQHLGMKIVKEENIAIGNGFWMEDYVLELDIHNEPKISFNQIV